MINFNSVVSILENHDSQLWDVRVIKDSNEECKFIPIFETEHKNGLTHYYGLINKGYWVSDIPTHSLVSQPEYYVPFMPILEFRRSFIIRQIHKGLISTGLPDVLLTTFPFDSILEKSWSRWTLLAENWVNDQYPLNDTLCKMFPRNAKVIAHLKARENILYNIE